MADFDKIFLSTLSLRRATIHGVDFRNAFMHFYPRSPCGERPGTTSAKMQRWDFYPRSPCGERRLAGPSGPAFLFNFYPRSPCGERHLATW